MFYKEMKMIDSFKVKLTGDKHKLRCTVPASQIRKINAKPDDYVKLTIMKESLTCQTYFKVPSIPPSRINLQVKVAIPPGFIREANLKKGDFMSASLFRLHTPRTSQLRIPNCLDLLAIIPGETKTGKAIMVDLINKNSEDWLNIWYCPGKGGRPGLVEVRRFIPITRHLGEFFGLMQA